MSGIPISSQFNLSAQLPLRKYDVVTSLGDRDLIPDICRFIGKKVEVADTGLGTYKTYQLQGGITNADWVDVTNGGGSSGNEYYQNFNDTSDWTIDMTNTYYSIVIPVGTHNCGQYPITTVERLVSGVFVNENTKIETGNTGSVKIIVSATPVDCRFAGRVLINGAIGSSSITPTNILYADLQNLIATDSVIVGQRYLITDRGDLGLLVYGNSPHTISVKADGGFLNADWQYGGNYSSVEPLTTIPVTLNIGQWRPVSGVIEYNPYITTYFETVSSVTPMSVADTLTGGNGSTVKVRAIGTTERIYLNPFAGLPVVHTVGDTIQVRDVSNNVLQEGTITAIDPLYLEIGSLTQSYFADGLAYQNYLNTNVYMVDFTTGTGTFNVGDLITDDQSNTATILYAYVYGSNGQLIVTYGTGKIGDSGATTFTSSSGGSAPIHFVQDVSDIALQVMYNADITVTSGGWSGAGFFTDDMTSATGVPTFNTALGFNTTEVINDTTSSATGFLTNNTDPSCFTVSNLRLEAIVGDFVVGDIITDVTTGQVAEVSLVTYVYQPLLGDIVIYDNIHWQRTSMTEGNSTTTPSSSPDYMALPKSIAQGPVMGYISVWNEIEYDFGNDQIYFRRDDLNNVDFRGTSGLLDYPWGRVSWGDNHINMAAFINPNCVGNIYSNTLLEGSSLSDNQLDDSSIIRGNVLSGGTIINNRMLFNSGITENQIGVFTTVNYNTLCNDSYISQNTSGYRGTIDNNTMLDHCYIILNVLTGDGSHINGNNLYSTSSIGHNEIDINATIYNNDITYSNIMSNRIGQSCGIAVNVLASSSVINENTMEDSSEISNNTLSASSRIEHNSLDTNSVIDYNLLPFQSYITLNEMYAAQMSNNQMLYSSQIYENDMPIGSSIYGNVFSYGGGSISNNTLNNRGSIDSNTIGNGGGVVGNEMLGSGGSQNYTQIYDNKMANGGLITNNTLHSEAQIIGNIILAGGIGIERNVLMPRATIIDNTMDLSASMVNNSFGGACSIHGNTFVIQSAIAHSTFGAECEIDGSNLSFNNGISYSDFGSHSVCKYICSINNCKIGDYTQINQNNTYQLTSVTLNPGIFLTQTADITGVPQLADDAAASGAGLVSGMYYKTTDTGSTILKIVP